MWKIIQIIAEIIFTDGGAEVIAAKFAKYTTNLLGKWTYTIANKTKLGKFVIKSHQLFKSVQDKADFMIHITDPMKLIQLIKKMPRKEVNELIKNARGKFKKNLERAKDIAVKKTDENREAAVRANVNAVNEYKKNLKTTEKDYKPEFVDKWYIMSSSWIRQAIFSNYNNKSALGRMTILIKADFGVKWYGPYVYPSIKYSTFLNMLSAMGKNGSGAGSVFWREFLGEWITSALRGYIKASFFKSNLKLQDNIEWWREKNNQILQNQRERLQHLESGYYRSAMSNFETGISNKYFKQDTMFERNIYLQNQKQIFKNNFEHQKQLIRSNFFQTKQNIRNELLRNNQVIRDSFYHSTNIIRNSKIGKVAAVIKKYDKIVSTKGKIKNTITGIQKGTIVPRITKKLKRRK